MSPLLATAFATAERLGGRPVHLYTFTKGSTVWRYTDDGAPITIPATGLTYLAAKIEHDEIARSDESGAADIRVMPAKRLGIIDALRDGSTDVMHGWIHRYHVTAGGVPALFARGEVGSPTMDGAKCELVLHTTDSRFGSQIPAAQIGVQCWKQTYGPECGVKWQEFAFDTTITAIGRRVITVASVDAQPDGYYSLGFVKQGTQLVYIAEHVGTVLNLLTEVPRAFATTGAGADVTLLKGDDHSQAACKTFDNILNFGGFPNLPGRNPLLNR
jgi:uncharacterized phage protein (TIGR02218 family)